MSKYEVVRLFDIMKTYIFWIILFDFSHSVLCMQYCNVSGLDPYPVCPYKFIRRKRAPIDSYTRWGPLTKPSTEFIVKVLDEEDNIPSTPRIPIMTGIIGVNYEPERKHFGKIIVGGAAVGTQRPMATHRHMGLPQPIGTLETVEDPLGPLDYTRFGVPNPTVPPVHPTNTPPVSSVYTSPKSAVEMFIPRLPNRDESPPASPHFVLHTQLPKTSLNPLMNVVPVTFARHTYTIPSATPKRVAWYVHLTKNPHTTAVEQTNYKGLMTSIQKHKMQSKTAQPTRTYSIIFRSFQHMNTRPKSLGSDFVYKKRKDPTRTSMETVEFIPIKDFAFQTLAEVEFLSVKDFAFQTIAEEARKATMSGEPTRVSKDSDKENDVYNVFDNDYDNYPLGGSKSVGSESGNTDEEARNQRQIEEDIRSMEKVVDLKKDGKLDIEFNEPNTNSDEDLTETNYFSPRTFPTSRTARSSSTGRTARTTDISIDYTETTTPTTGKVNYKLEPNGSITITQNLKLFKTVCSLIKLRPLSFSRTATLPEIIDTMKHWADVSPLAQLVDITEGNYTVMENSIFMMMVDDPSHGQAISAKDTVMIIAGIQGRDHHAVLSAMYVLYQLIERSDTHSDILSRYRFWVIPVLNPDGYDYSMSFEFHRNWKKNLRQSWEYCDGKTDRNKLTSCKMCESLGIRCFVQPCYGVNLDRNFEYQWIPPNELHTEYPCGDLFPGKHQLSEQETFSLTNFLHQQPTKLHTFLALKEGDVLGIMYPYSHTRKKRMFNHVYRQRATAAARAAFGINGRQYVAGQTSEFLPLYAGGIEDWFDGHLGIDHTYAIVMSQPHYAKIHKEGFLEGVVHESFAAIDTLLLQKVAEPDALPKVVLTQNSRRNLAFRYTQSRLKIICSIISVAVLS